MKRFLILGLAALIGTSVAAGTSEAAWFRRGWLFNRYSYTTPYVQGHKTSSQNNLRAEGHTEATGTGTTIDGNGGRHVKNPRPAPHIRPDSKVEGNTEKTGTGTQIDGR